MARVKDVDPAYLGLSDCPDDPGCMAIVLLDETELNNSMQAARASYHRMVKVFTSEGIDRFSDINIPEDVSAMHVRNLSGRTILPDGRVIKLSQDNVSVKTVFRYGRYRLRVKSARFAGVVPGAIIDYSYDRRTSGAADLTYMLWELQQEIPVLETRFTLRPGGMRFQWGQEGATKVPIDERAPYPNVHYFSARNIPPVRPVPLGPPPETVATREIFYSQMYGFARPVMLTVGMQSEVARLLERSGDLTDTASEIVEGEQSGIGRLRRIYDYVQNRVGPQGGGAREDSGEETEEIKDIGQVLSRGRGTEFERTLLFAALAKAAGLDAVLLVVAPRDSGVEGSLMPDISRYDSYAAAVLIGHDWGFYDPAGDHCPFGQVSPEKEGGSVLGIGLGTHRTPAFKRLPASPPLRNVLERLVSVTLAVDGSARVEVTETASGLAGLDIWRTYGNLDDEDRRAALLARLRSTLPAARLTESGFENLDAPERPTVIRYGAQVDGAAQVAQGRIILTPALFGRAQPSPFTAPERNVPVYFPHTQKTIDRVTFHLPQGYAPTELPEEATFRQGNRLLVWDVEQEDGVLIFNRHLEIGDAVVEAAAYPALKEFFDKVQRLDRQAILLDEAAE